MDFEGFHAISKTSGDGYLAAFACFSGRDAAPKESFTRFQLAATGCYFIHYHGLPRIHEIYGFRGSDAYQPLPAFQDEMLALKKALLDSRWLLLAAISSIFMDFPEISWISRVGCLAAFASFQDEMPAVKKALLDSSWLLLAIISPLFIEFRGFHEIL